MSLSEGARAADYLRPDERERLSADGIPWRGPGRGRPDLPLPPAPMPLLRSGRLRKRWRYVGVYGAELMLCAARVEFGPFRQAFWQLWDREQRRSFGHTRLRPGSREVVMDGAEVWVRAPGMAIALRLGDAAPVESVCPSGERGYAWTRKRAGIPIDVTIELEGKRRQMQSEGVEDVSAGYHERHTSWRWSAGTGRATDGRALAWNLVSGINDPSRGSERAIWIEGVPQEPPPVSFEALDAIEFADRSRLCFAGESERARDDNLLVFRSRYLHRFGAFSGSLDGIPLEHGYGVMERHEAIW